MGRIIGLIGCTCLVIAAMRMANFTQYDAATLKGGEDRVKPQEALTPRAHFKKGKELYLRGSYKLALPHLEEAALAKSGLTPAERRQTDECLNRARAKVQGVALASPSEDLIADDVVVRGQSDNWDEKSSDSEQANPAKDRVNQLMIQAKAAFKNGDKTEALKLARLANSLAKGAKLTFSEKEMSPAKFLAVLSSPQADTKNLNVVQTAATETSSDGIRQASGNDSEAQAFDATEKSAGSAEPVTLKEKASLLLVQAREDIKAGRLDDARRRALEANELGVTYKILDDDRPELVLAEIDRRAKTKTLPRNTAAASDATDADQPVDGVASNKDRAKELLKQARTDLRNGKLEAAKAKAEQARAMNVKYSLWEEMPEVVLSEIEEKQQVAADGAATAAPAKGRASDDVAVAKDLLAKAKKAMKEGRFEEAREFATQADKLKVAFGLFDESPDIVLDKIAKAENQSVNMKSSTKSNASHLAAAQSEAIEQLKGARELIKEGRFDEARIKALKVKESGAQLPVSADSPDLVLADLDKAEAKVVAKFGRSNNVVTTASNEEVVAEPTGKRGSKAQVQQAADVEEVPDFAQSGLSASELYDRGLSELKRGNSEIAYRAFKAANDSGQRLDPVRARRMKDYLRELSPRGKSNNIQLTNNETISSPLEAARQEQSVKMERVREEVLNVVYKAERMKESDPEKAMELIDQTMSKVESAELSPEATASLLKHLNRSRTSLASEIETQKPNLELKAENKRVKDSIKKDIENSIRIDQELAKKVDEFNELMDQQRYAEAEIMAKQAEVLSPKDPTVVMMKLKAKFARQDKFNKDLREDKDNAIVNTLNDVERAIIPNVFDDHPMDFDKDTWKRIAGRKDKYGGSNKIRSESELNIESSLRKRISLHEENVPLSEIIKKIKAVADINIVTDEAALEEVNVNASTTLVSIDVDNIMIKSALNLILQKHELGYMYADEALKITSRNRQQGDLEPQVYNVTDLVIPIPNFGAPAVDQLFNTPTAQAGGRPFGNQAYLNPGFAGQAFAQVGPNGNGFAALPPNRGGDADRASAANRNADFTALTELITSTIAPDTWTQGGGEANIQPFPGTLSLVIRQTQKVHEEIHDLLEQLRRLQDLQVTVEVRFVTVADRFFERIGIDFDFNIKPTTGYPKLDNSALPIPAFGSVLLPQQGLLGSTSQTGTTGGGSTTGGGGTAGGTAGAGGGTAGTTGGTAGTTSGTLFSPGPTLNLVNNPQNTTIVGLQNPDQFTSDLTVPFQQGSFNVGIPTFGGYNPNAGVQTGIAILSDLEAFFFIQAAQGDQRNNLLFAPKITLFNGQTAFVNDTKSRPFVTSLIPTVGIGAVGYTPVVTTIPEGVRLTATAVVSADRRFVRLTLSPFFTSITDVFTYQVTGAGAGGGGGAQAGGGQQGGQGGFGGGQFGGGGGGGQAGGGGQLGIGGGLGSMQIMHALFTQTTGGQTGQAGGQAGQAGGQAGQTGGQAGQQTGGGQVISVQQPVVEIVTLNTTVSVPDGGTVLLGGIKRLKEGRTMSGVPILNKIPYVSRLFKNSGVGRETESLMMMVTPRIIIQEEEESLLGLTRE